MSNASSGANSEQQSAMWVHLAGIVFPGLAGLVGYLVLKDKSAYLAKETKSALNWGISMFILWVATTIVASVVWVLFFVPGLVWVLNAVFCLIAGLAVNGGKDSKYPVSIAYIK